MEHVYIHIYTLTALTKIYSVTLIIPVEESQHPVVYLTQEPPGANVYLAALKSFNNTSKHQKWNNTGTSIARMCAIQGSPSVCHPQTPQNVHIAYSRPKSVTLLKVPTEADCPYCLPQQR